MAGDRRKSIGINNGLDTQNSVHPIENPLADPNPFWNKDSFGHFRFPKAYSRDCFFELHFSCLVSMTAVRFTQRTDSNHGTWMIRHYNEKTGAYEDLISSRGFNWRGKDFTISLNDNVGRRYMFALVQGPTTPNVDIHPLVFNLKVAYFLAELGSKFRI